MAFGDILSGIWDFGSKLFQTGYNLYTNQRDFDYQKDLQQQIFEREDTAVQRRMEDLKAAGLNPNLAAGSSAGAGAVVGRSSTNDIGVGSALDTMSAINQIKLQRLEKDNAQIQNKILGAQNRVAQMNSNMQQMYMLHQMGYDVWPSDFGKGYKSHGENDGEPSNDKIYTNRRGFTIPMFDEYDNNLNYLKNSNEYLQRELNWYNANQIADMLTGGIGAITGTVNAGANMKKANSMLRR